MNRPNLALLSNRSTYYTGVSPEFDGEYILTYMGRDAASATVRLNASLVVQSSGEEGGLLDRSHAT